jgi:ribA/ribD-fused uncharacterized protein
MNSPIENWSNEFQFLRNDFPCDVEIEEDDGSTYTYSSAEAAFQAGKTTDQDDREAFVDCIDAHDAKQLGRALPLPPDWDQVRISRMERVLRAKFTDDEDLAERLKGTGSAPLIMVNRRDDFWGMIRQPDGSLSGRNMLGDILMKIRTELDPSLSAVQFPTFPLPDIKPSLPDKLPAAWTGGADITDVPKVSASTALQRAVALSAVGDLETKLQKCGVDSKLAKAMANLYEAGKKAAKEFGDGSESTLAGIIVTKIEHNPSEYAKLVGDVGKAVENLATTVSELGA